jgi:hypothetical protein
MADTRPLSERMDAAWVLAQTDSGAHIDPGLLHEAAELARKVESAPVGSVIGARITEATSVRKAIEIAYVGLDDAGRVAELACKRVALVPVEGE